jgi:hypothetical protein
MISTQIILCLFNIRSVNMKPLFCPNCHRRVEIPKMLLNSNIKAENGVKLQCGYCKSPKKGIVKFYPPIKEDDNDTSKEV